MYSKVTVVVPIKHENDPFLSSCLDSLHHQDFSEGFEILIVKGGNRSQARNLGLFSSKSDYIAFIDSDCIAPKNWLSTLFNVITKSEVSGVGGLGVSPPNGTLLSRTIDHVFSTSLGSLGKASVCSNIQNKKARKVSGLSAHNSLFKRKVLLDVGGFDENFELNEDTNLCHKLRTRGHELLLVPEAFVYHRRRDSLKDFAKHFFKYGVGRQRSILTNIAYLDKRFLFFLMAPLILILFSSINQQLMVVTLATYLAITTFYGVYFAYKTKELGPVYLTPLLFSLEHGSYGLGIIYGVFRGSWKQDIKSINENPVLAKRIRLHAGKVIL